MVKQRMSSSDVAAEVACLRQRILGLRVANIYDLTPKVGLGCVEGCGEEKRRGRRGGREEGKERTGERGQRRRGPGAGHAHIQGRLAGCGLVVAWAVLTLRL